MTLWAWAWALGSGLGCVTGATVRSQASVLEANIEAAHRSGALRCAPKELATAEAHYDFTLGELDEGQSYRAQQHVVTGDVAVQRALEMSKSCGPKQVLVKEPKLLVRIEETDRDGDGIVDVNDRCIDQPEDKDEFQDSDGCPEPDNDNDGLLDGADRCPNVAGPISNIGCPIIDTDGDGIWDEKDKCPTEAEDKDGFQDDDGCPEPDNDSDGLKDGEDKCPNDPGPADTQGCPRKYSLVVVTREKIQIKKQIKFATGSHKIVGYESSAILKDVAQALADNQQIKRVRIEGHTDAVGNDEANMKLSSRRAESVKEALVKLGVVPERLEASGYGESAPIASNSTAAGRQENRRTEFNIVEQ